MKIYSRVFCLLIFVLMFSSLSIPQAPPSKQKEGIDQRVDALKEELIRIRRDIHQHPELGNQELRTAALVADHLRKLGLEVTTGVAKTGVVGLLRGGKPGVTVAVRADMDALPITELNDVPYASVNQGVMHACGHDVHTTVALGVATVLSQMKDELPGTVKFIFQPAEEGSPTGERGGAELMVEEGVLDNPRVSAIFGLHVMPHLEIGTIGLIPGAAMASSDQFEIDILGKMSHGALPAEGVDAIAAAAQVITALQTMVSRNIDPRYPVVCTVGVVRGGNRFNIIADKVTLQGTVRTLDAKVREAVPTIMERIIKGVTSGMGADYQFQYYMGPPVTSNDPQLAKEMAEVIESVVGKGNLLYPIPLMVAEDFSQYALKVPGLFLFLGVRNEEKGLVQPIHNPSFNVDEDCLPLGVKVMTHLVVDYLNSRSSLK
ncbi:MAG: amidohydrolase [Candidatus Aminicenantes bacterium]|nr:amidohydrolase [Candidatus Aminicenantes bacterium]